MTVSQYWLSMGVAHTEDCEICNLEINLTDTLCNHELSTLPTKENT